MNVLPLRRQIAPLTQGRVFSPLLEGLVSYWKLDEASGVREDSHGSNHLTDNNTVGQAAGKVGNAAAFVAANEEKLTVASNAGLRAQESFTFGLWIWADSYPSSATLISKDDGDGGPDYRLDIDAGSTFRWFVFPSLLQSFSLAVPAPGGWHYLVVWRDGSDNKLHIQMDNGTDHSGGASTPNVGDKTLTIGSLGPTRPAQFCWDGRIDEIGFWHRALTAAERTALYNSGNGLAYPFS